MPPRSPSPSADRPKSPEIKTGESSSEKHKRVESISLFKEIDQRTKQIKLDSSTEHSEGKTSVISETDARDIESVNLQNTKDIINKAFKKPGTESTGNIEQESLVPLEQLVADIQAELDKNQKTLDKNQHILDTSQETLGRADEIINWNVSENEANLIRNWEAEHWPEDDEPPKIDRTNLDNKININQRRALQTEKHLTELRDIEKKIRVTMIEQEGPTQNDYAHLREKMGNRDQALLSKVDKQDKYRQEQDTKMYSLYASAMDRVTKLREAIKETQGEHQAATQRRDNLKLKELAGLDFFDVEGIVELEDSPMEFVREGRLPGASLPRAIKTLLEQQKRDEQQNPERWQNIDLSEENIAERLALYPYGNMINGARLEDSTLSDLGDTRGLELRQVEKTRQELLLASSNGSIIAGLDNAHTLGNNVFAVTRDGTRVIKDETYHRMRYVTLQRTGDDLVVFDETREKPFQISVDNFFPAWDGTVVLPKDTYTSTNLEL